MMMSSEHVTLLGGAQTDFERNYTREGKNEIGLISEVVHDALREAGVLIAENTQHIVDLCVELKEGGKL